MLEEVEQRLFPPVEILEHDNRWPSRGDLVEELDPRNVEAFAGNERVPNFEDIVRLDCQYIDTWSFRHDVEILIRTVIKVLKRSGW